MQQLSNESRLVLLLTKASLSDSELDEVDRLFSKHFNWQSFFGRVYYHRVTGLVSEAMTKKKFKSWIHKEFKNSIWSSAEMFFLRSQKELKYIQQLHNLLVQHEIKYAFLKGVELNYTIYSRHGLRISTDADLLVHPDSLTLFNKVINQLGYIQGDYDYLKKITPVDRSKKILHKINSHELYPYMKIINEPGLDVQILDIHHSVQLGEGVKNHNKHFVEELLDRSVLQNTSSLSFRSLCAEDSLVFLCAHLAKDAQSTFYKQRGMNLQLYKFCDIHHYIKRKRINWERFFEVAEILGYIQEIEYALYYTEDLYPGTIPEGIECKISNKEPGWLAARLFKESEEV
ncbi:nucleotidyltransferase family protein [Paenibacillus polymyxa]|uniref:nucleotidyltransferase family protein n=1 Tax=Paenibacillus polymyxa TaxID=1406 RepID=UPI001BE89C89|nr:nucleotidyltransferase family protein [Paenibacillus polymyxa]MBT2282964.1 nucleotidyltransferase family protein [Paenibacillus polymyxa]